MARLTGIIQDGLLHIIQEFSDDARYKLTESDLVMYTHTAISDKVGRHRIHSELVPYLRENGNLKVIRKINDEIKWASYTPRGMRFDLCVLKPDKKYFEDAVQVRTERTHDSRIHRSRIPLYPRKAIKIAIEFKVRGTGGLVKIKKDIRKLSLLCSTDSDCIGFFVLLDRNLLESPRSGSLIESRKELFENIKNETKSNIFYLDHNSLLNGAEGVI
jgi:hypothetical protein